METKLPVMLFLANDFYPHGGWKDFKGFFDSIESAKQWVIINEPNPCCDWCHIVQDGLIVLYGEESDDYSWKWRLPNELD